MVMEQTVPSPVSVIHPVSASKTAVLTTPASAKVSVSDYYFFVKMFLEALEALEALSVHALVQLQWCIILLHCVVLRGEF